MSMANPWEGFGAADAAIFFNALKQPTIMGLDIDQPPLKFPTHWNNNSQHKTPKGLKPHHEWQADVRQMRIAQIKEAISRYMGASLQIPIHWLKEYDELLKANEGAPPPPNLKPPILRGVSSRIQVPEGAVAIEINGTYCYVWYDISPSATVRPSDGLEVVVKYTKDGEVEVEGPESFEGSGVCYTNYGWNLSHVKTGYQATAWRYKLKQDEKPEPAPVVAQPVVRYDWRRIGSDSLEVPVSGVKVVVQYKHRQHPASTVEGTGKYEASEGWSFHHNMQDEFEAVAWRYKDGHSDSP